MNRNQFDELSTRVLNGLRGTPARAFVNGVDTSTTGIKLTYTCPTGRIAVVKYITGRAFNGSPTWQFETAPSDRSFVLTHEAFVGHGQAEGIYVVLDQGDLLDINVGAAVASSAMDFVISVQEFDRAFFNPPTSLL